MFHRYSFDLVLFLISILFPRRHKITESPGFRQRQKTPVSITGSMPSRPPRHPRSTVVVASQTRLVAPRLDLCRRPCRVISGLYPTQHHLKPCRDPFRDVLVVVSDAVVGLPHVVGVGSHFRKARAICFEKTCDLIDVEKGCGRIPRGVNEGRERRVPSTVIRDTQRCYGWFLNGF